MNRFAVVAVALAIAAAAGESTSRAAAVVGDPAPAFTLTDTNGQAHSLAALKGKTVVLEWWNYECPFVGKHYGSGNMQKLQKEWTAKGVVWLTVNSSAAGTQGFAGRRLATERLVGSDIVELDTPPVACALLSDSRGSGERLQIGSHVSMHSLVCTVVLRTTGS